MLTDGTYVLRDSRPAEHDGIKRERVLMVKDGEVAAIYMATRDGFSLTYETAICNAGVPPAVDE